MENTVTAGPPVAVPFPTVHSHRDPGGLNPVGVEEVVGEDPMGVRTTDPAYPTRGQPPPTPTRKNTNATTPVMALLVGVPPPPPSTPPPKKKKRSNSTPRTSNHRRSPSPSRGLPSTSPQTLVQDNTGLSGSDTVTTADLSSLLTKNSSAEKRRAITRAIYEAESSMSLDPPTGLDHVGRPAMGDQPTPRIGSSRDQENKTPPAKNATSPKFHLQQLPRSPLSVSTEPTSNHVISPRNDLVSAQKESKSPAAVVEDEEIAHQQSLETTTSEQEQQSGKLRRIRAKTPDLLRPKTPERLRRALSVGHRRENSDGGVSSSGKSSRRRLQQFNRPKTPTDDQRSTTPGRRRAKTPDGRGRESHVVQHSRSASSGSFVSMTGINKSRSGSSGESSSKKSKTAGGKGFLRKLFSKKIKHRKDKDDSSGDEDYVPPGSTKQADAERVHSENHQRMPTFPSHESGSHSFEDERGSVFFAHDEVSTLTAPTYEEMHTGRDPIESKHRHSSEPNGIYWNNLVSTASSRDGDGFPSIDPFTEPFFQEPDGASPMPNKSGVENSLRISTGQQLNDPVGESPLHSKKYQLVHKAKHHDPSPRGYQTPHYFEESELMDPFGESPLHKHERGPTALVDGLPYAQDPPLYLAELERTSDSENEEKKEDDKLHSISPSAFNRGTMSQPPPPPTQAPSPRSRSTVRNGQSPRLPPRSDSPRSVESSVKETIHPVNNMSPQSLRSNSPSNSSPRSTPSSSETNGNQIALSPPVASKAQMNEIDDIEEELKVSASETSFSRSQDVKTVGEESFATEDSRQSSESKKQKKKKKKPDHLTMSAAARMNAKAVAYLHTMNGEPSPRHAWRRPEVSDDDMTPPASVLVQPSKAFFGVKPHVQKKQTLFNATAKEVVSRQTFDDENQPLAVDNGATKIFSAYSGKFKGRKVSHQGHVVTHEATKKKPINSTKILPVAKSTKKTLAWKQSYPIGRDVSVTTEVVAVGLSLLKTRREEAIACGLSKRVVVDKRPKVPKVKSYFGPYDDVEPKDPIQRAGRRLLSKAAIPIQTAARRFLAQKEAVDRMWALLEIQSYFRRWRAQAYLLAYKNSATEIQRVFRGDRVRFELGVQDLAATEIQRVTRGYLTSIHVFEEVYRITLVQARYRGMLVRRELERKNHAVNVIQSAFRGYRARSSKDKKLRSIIKIQSACRAYLFRLCFQFVVVDIIIAQSAVRRWLALTHFERMKHQIRFDSAAKIQAVWRGYHTYSGYRWYRAATKIQAAWRAFQAYTDYIFAVVDILVIQRNVRMFLAKRQLEKSRETKAAIVIQKHWRRHSARLGMVLDLVHIIIVQSIARRFLTKAIVAKLKQQRSCCEVAATKIQALWRGFWLYSHFIIIRYETIRIQAAMRGALVRRKYAAKIGYAIILQSAARRSAAIRKAIRERVGRALTASRVEGLREVGACKKIQFFWRVVLDCRKEKKAALVIERFFVMVKKEVDREIKMAQERKEARRRKKQSHNEEAFLEHVWIDTVDENHVDVFALSQSVSFGSRSNFSLPDAGTPHSRTSIRHQASSPTMNMVMRHDDDTKSLPSSSRSIELSLRSEKRRPKSARAKTGGYLDSFEKRAPSASSHKQSTDSKHKSSVSDTYKELYNLKTAPSHSSTGQHFFGKEPDRSRREQKPPLSTRSDSMHRRSLSSNSEPEAKLAVSGKSPRHGKMLVMNPYPKAQVPSREDLDVNEI